jgi:hypothetical protein
MCEEMGIESDGGGSANIDRSEFEAGNRRDQRESHHLIFQKKQPT